MPNQDVWTFMACVVASFALAWATAMLSDVAPFKALAAGIVAAAAYILGKQQTPMGK